MCQFCMLGDVELIHKESLFLPLRFYITKINKDKKIYFNPRSVR